MDLTRVIKECEARISDGASNDELVIYLHQQGLNIVESIRALKEICNVTLGEAKKIVTTHPIWTNEVKSADSLHEELEKALRKGDFS